MTATASDVKEEKAVQEAVASEPMPGAPQGQIRTCASSIAKTTLAALTAFWTVVTLRVQVAGVRVTAAVSRPGSLVHDRLPTFAEAWARQCECARHYKTAMWFPWLQYPRYVWGFIHVCVVKPVLNFLEWLSESPLRFCITAVTVFAIYWFS